MSDPRPAAGPRDPEGLTLPRMTVAVLGGRHVGAVAYALRAALVQPATIELVHAREDMPVVGVAALDVRELSGPVEASLLAAGAEADVMVVEVAAREAERLTDPWLVHLRRHTVCLLVEVDAAGAVVGASGPVSDVVSAAAPPAPAGGGAVLVVGVDGSAAGDEVVAWARAEAERRGAVLRLVGVHASGTSPEPALEALRAARDRCPGPGVETVLVAGEPVGALVSQATGADLLVVGGHRSTGMIHSALGGVGDACARLADCPVVIVPHHATDRFAQAGTDHVSRVPPLAD